MSLTRIVAVIVDTRLLTLYTETGKSLEINQGDARVRRILDAMPTIESQGYADIDLTTPNPYRDFEEKSGGVVRFFRAAKKAVAGIFSAPESDVTAPVGRVGRIPKQEAEAPVPHMSQAAAVAEIQKNAKPVNDPEFDAGSLDSNETIVAVVGDKVIPGAENLKGHLKHSTTVGSTKGLEAFYARLTPIIEKRGHSVEDILRFMEKNDLPIADDGCLIIYKVLKKRNGVYYDCHTGKVPQKIGSVVCVDESLVDKNRRNECSSGLHVARRGYIGGFPGDVCTLVKVAPEDVITVPHGDPNKVRVCRYHILMELDRDSWDKLKNNVPMTSNPKAQAMLGRAVAGEHVGVLEIVKIGGQYGANVTVTPVEGAIKAPKQASQKAVALDDETIKKEELTDLKVAEAAMKEVISDKAKAAGSSRQAHVRGLYDTMMGTTDKEARVNAARELMAFKKKAKVSWLALGIQEHESVLILRVAGDAPPVEAAKLVQSAGKATQKSKTAKKAAKVTKTLPKPQKASKAVAKPEPTPVPEPVKEAVPGPSGRKAKLYDLNKVYSDVSRSNAERASAATEMLELRKQAKQSWVRLGYPELTDQLIRDDVEKLAAVTLPEPERSPAGSRQEQARAMFDASEWDNLWALKRTTKIGWERLGFTPEETITINENKPV